MNQPDDRRHEHDRELQNARGVRHHKRVETNSDRLGQNLRVLHHQYRENQGKQPDVVAPVKAVELCTGNRRAECVRRRIQNEDDRDRFLNIVLQSLADLAESGMAFA